VSIYNAAVGTKVATSAAVTKKLWDSLTHEQVMDSVYFKRFTADDTGNEATLSEQKKAAMPIMRKTQLGKEGGDQIRMTLVKQLTGGGSSIENAGQVADDELIENEESIAFSNIDVRIENWRHAVGVRGRMTNQRTPFQVRSKATRALSNLGALFHDASMFFTFYVGCSPHLLRSGIYTTSSTGIGAHPNSYMTTATDPVAADLDSMAADATPFNAGTLDWLGQYVAENNINPVIVDGQPKYIVIVSPSQARTLRADQDWQDAMLHVAEKGKENPIFSGALGEYNGFVVHKHNKIWTGARADFDNLAVTSKAIVFSDITNENAIADADVHGAILMGAHSVALAQGGGVYQERRKEDDYGNIKGYSLGHIFGAKRADWENAARDGVWSNQSSAVIWTNQG